MWSTCTNVEGVKQVGGLAVSVEKCAYMYNNSFKLIFQGKTTAVDTDLPCEVVVCRTKHGIVYALDTASDKSVEMMKFMKRLDTHIEKEMDEYYRRYFGCE